MKKLLVFGLMLVAANAFAQIDPDPNSVGIYFDEGGMTNCLVPAPYSNVNAYVCATRISSANGISGWEATVVTEPATLPAGINYALNGTGALNVLTPPIFQVGIASALPYADSIKLLTISTFYLGGQILFGLAPCVPSSFGGLSAGFADGLNPGLLVPLAASCNAEIASVPHGYWVAGVNAGPTCPVATENNSWSGVKNLYQ